MILIYGAGVIGQIYAARLHEVGHDVTVLARHRTLETLARARYEARDITVAEHWPEDVVAAPLRSMIVTCQASHMAWTASWCRSSSYISRRELRLVRPLNLVFSVSQLSVTTIRVPQSDKRRACRHNLSGVLS
jgi:hypothetical protein